MTKVPDSIAFDSAQFYRYIIDIIPCYISVLKRDSEILFANPAFRNDFGNPVNRKCHDIVRCSCFQRKTCPVEKTFRDNLTHICEDSFITKDGTVKQVLIHSVPLLHTDPSVPLDNVLEVGVDISSAKESQKELVRLGQSVALLSHDIKNTLEGLHGGEYVVDEGLHDKDCLLIEKGWKVVKNNISDISIIAQNILYSSKKKSLNIEKVDPGDIVKQAVSMLGTKAANLHVDLSSQVDSFPFEVKLDPFTIKSMLVNLISNALEACARDKTKKNKRVFARALAYNEFQFKFEVEDNGVGIEEETKNKIFKEFFSTRGTHGTGLGLSVVEKVVKEHGGKIELESAPGKGTIFRVILRL